MEIILKSASPRRKELLTNAGISFKIQSADIDETMDASLTAYENVKQLGLKKALHEREKFEDAILIGCDTIVVLDGIIYGKPQSEEDAFLTLKILSGKKHEVMSGVGIVYKNLVYNFVVVSEVYFKKLTDQQIKEYIATKECFGKAGSYAIQGIGNQLIDHYEGSLENIIGLPVDEVLDVIGEINEMVY